MNDLTSIFILSLVSIFVVWHLSYRFDSYEFQRVVTKISKSHLYVLVGKDVRKIKTDKKFRRNSDLEIKRLNQSRHLYSVTIEVRKNAFGWTKETAYVRSKLTEGR